MARIVLVRHGQTEWNRAERFRGQVDVPLNEVGHAQARAVARRLADWPPARGPYEDKKGHGIATVYSSPLSRAMETARPTADLHGLAVQPEPGLLDINYGEWGGLSSEEAQARDPDLLAQWLMDPGSVIFPGGEGLADVQTRAMAAIERMVREHMDQTVMAVGHVVVNRALLLGVLGAPLSHFWDIGQDNGAINVLEWRHGRLMLALLNDTCHLS
jgi:broad specificity phosphatase PhoE